MLIKFEIKGAKYLIDHSKFYLTNQKQKRYCTTIDGDDTMEDYENWEFVLDTGSRIQVTKEIYDEVELQLTRMNALIMNPRFITPY